VKLHPKSGFFAGQVTAPAQKTEGGMIKPDSAFLLTGRCGLLAAAEGEDGCPALCRITVCRRFPRGGAPADSKKTG